MNGDAPKQGSARAELIETIAKLPPADRVWVTKALTVTQLHELEERWAAWAHDGQFEPPGDRRVSLIRAGRGFGKTRAGAEWVSRFSRDHAGARIALVGDTAHDVATVMVEGVSGLIAVAKIGERPKWSRMRGEVRWENGAIAQVYSANAAEGLRGPEHHAAQCADAAGDGDGRSRPDAAERDARESKSAGDVRIGYRGAIRGDAAGPAGAGRRDDRRRRRGDVDS